MNERMNTFTISEYLEILAIKLRALNYSAHDPSTGDKSTCFLYMNVSINVFRRTACMERVSSPDLSSSLDLN